MVGLIYGALLSTFDRGDRDEEEKDGEERARVRWVCGVLRVRNEKTGWASLKPMCYFRDPLGTV